MKDTTKARAIGFNHVALEVGDIDEALAFYGRFFDFTADATGAWNLPGPYEKRRLLARAVNGHGLPTGPGMIGPR